MRVKKIISLLFVFVLCICFFTGTASARIAEPTSTITTNGNGGKTDIGAWYITYNNSSMWANNFGSGYPIKYRTLMPNGSYGILDSANIKYIDFQLQQLADAKVDFILFDLTNGGLTNKLKYGWSDVAGKGNNWIVDNAKLACQRIAVWNKSHNWKIKYAVAVGAYEAIRKDNSIGQCAEWQAEAVYKEFYMNSTYGGSNYYQINGKPLLVLHHWGYNVLTCSGGWNSYTGVRTYGDKFTVRNGQSGEAGTYGWHTAKGTQVDAEVEVVCPGQNTAGPSKANILRNNGKYYKESWEVVLSNTLPRIVMIASFNDYNEQTGVFTADSSGCDGVIEEKWTDSTGKINNSMYWDMTKEGINLIRIANGELSGQFKSAWFDLSNSGFVNNSTSTNTNNDTNTNSQANSQNNANSSVQNNTSSNIQSDVSSEDSSATVNNNQSNETSGLDNSGNSVSNKIEKSKKSISPAVIILITAAILIILAAATVTAIYIIKAKQQKFEEETEGETATDSE